MTRKLFWDNPYQTECKACVTAVDGPLITLDQTIFFPFSGGQESDAGTIGGCDVIEARKEGVKISYLLPEGHGLEEGQTVAVEIDWQRRYRLMRLHFAAELALELMYRRLDSVEKIGAHIGENKARVDFLWPKSIASLLPELASEAEAIIAQNVPIISAFSDAHREKRYWEVAGFARVPCGGTHLKTTGEIGAVRLKRNNIGKGKERVEISLQQPG